MAFLQRLQNQKPVVEATTERPADTPNARLAFLQRLKNQRSSPTIASTTTEPAVDAPYTISSSRLAFLKRLKEQRDALAKQETTTAAPQAKLKVATTTTTTTMKSVVPTFGPFQTQAPANDNSDPQLRSIICKSRHKKSQPFIKLLIQSTLMDQRRQILTGKRSKRAKISSPNCVK